MRHGIWVVQRLLATFILLFSFLYIYKESPPISRIPAQAQKSCLRNLEAFTIKKRRWLRSYSDEVIKTKGLRIFLVHKQEDQTKRKLLNILEQYERPRKWSYWNIPEDTIQFIPRKLSAYFLKDGKEYNFTPIYSLSTPLRKALESGSFKLTGKKKQFTITTHLITGVFVIGYYEQEILNYLEGKKKTTYIDKMRSEWEYISEFIKYDARFHNIHKDFEKEVRIQRILLEKGLVSNEEYEKSLQRLKDKTTIEVQALTGELNSVNKIIFKSKDLTLHESNQLVTLLYESGYYFEDLKKFIAKNKIPSNQEDHLINARLRRIAVQNLLLKAGESGTMEFESSKAKEVSQELINHPTISFLYEQFKEGKIEKSDYISESQKYMVYVEKNAQYEILGIKRPLKDEEGEIIQGRFYELEDLQREYLEMIMNKYSN